MRTIQKLVQEKEEKKRSRFDFSVQSSLDQNEEIVLEITKENIKLRDYEQYKQILELIEFRMEQTFYDFPKEYITDNIWRRFSKYVNYSLFRIEKEVKIFTYLQAYSRL